MVREMSETFSLPPEIWDGEPHEIRIEWGDGPTRVIVDPPAIGPNTQWSTYGRMGGKHEAST